MCCTDQPNTVPRTPFAMAGGYTFPLQCGCGCIGKEQTAMRLNRYREHLKAELKHIETQIGELGKADQ